jgi:DNA repair protein RAD5
MTLPRESDFSMIDWKESYTRSSKIGKILQILEEQVLPKNDKCVIFTQFLGMIEMLQLDFDK